MGLGGWNSTLWGTGPATTVAASYPQVSAELIIYDVFRILGILRAGQTPNQDAVADCFRRLNQMIDSWTAEGLCLFAYRSDVLPVSPNVQTYTLGEGGTWNIARPTKILHANIRQTTGSSTIITPGGGLTWNEATQTWDQSTMTWDELAAAGSGSTSTTTLRHQEWELRHFDIDEWSAVTTKSSFGDPWAYYNDFAFPWSNVSLYPVPASGAEIVLYTQQASGQFADPFAIYGFPPGYADAILFNLAVDFAPFYSGDQKRQIDMGQIIAKAVRGKARIKSLNIKVPIMRPEAIFGRGCNGY